LAKQSMTNYGPVMLFVEGAGGNLVLCHK
jgi:hypothetical protein